MLVGQFQKTYTAEGGLLFYTFGSKECIDYFIGTGADPLRPFVEAVYIPFQILLVRSRKM